MYRLYLSDRNQQPLQQPSLEINARTSNKNAATNESKIQEKKKIPEPLATPGSRPGSECKRQDLLIRSDSNSTITTALETPESSNSKTYMELSMASIDDFEFPVEITFFRDDGSNACVHQPTIEEQCTPSLVLPNRCNQNDEQDKQIIKNEKNICSDITFIPDGFSAEFYLFLAIDPRIGDYQKYKKKRPADKKKKTDGKHTDICFVADEFLFA